jgi:RNA polymerase sigma-70 factor (ECF subfamily)
VIDSQAALVEYLARAARGDREAFRLLYERTAPKLLASARRILGSGSTAEDAMQEAYVRIWRHAGDFDPAIASPIAWMTTIARHAAIDMARSGPEKVSSASETLDTDLAERLAAPAAGGDCRLVSASLRLTAGACWFLPIAMAGAGRNSPAVSRSRLRP